MERLRLFCIVRLSSIFFLSSNRKPLRWSETDTMSRVTVTFLPRVTMYSAEWQRYTDHCCKMSIRQSLRSLVRSLSVMISYYIKIIEKKLSVYHTVNGDRALFRTSKTAKIIKVILLRAPCQNVKVQLNLNYFCCFRCVKQCAIAVNSVINCEFFFYYICCFLYFQSISLI